MSQQEDYLKYINDLELELREEKKRSSGLSNEMANSMFQAQEDSNLIEWQLELDDLLERVDHLLRGHELKYDDKGNQFWKESDDRVNKLFNEYGVQEILRILSMYLNRNTILSNYKEEVIDLKVYDFGIRLTDLIFNKYDKMFYYRKFEEHLEELFPGMKKEDLTKEQLELVKWRIKDEVLDKIKLYEIMVSIIVDSVHSAYLRALHGGERESLRTARTVSQNDPIINQNQYGVPNVVNSQRKSIFKPSTWFRT